METYRINSVRAYIYIMSVTLWIGGMALLRSDGGALVKILWRWACTAASTGRAWQLVSGLNCNAVLVL